MTKSVSGEALYVSGDPLPVDHTPSSAVAVGEVVVQGHVPMVAHAAIAADIKGALAAKGGIYQCAPDAAIAIGQPVWWDDTANEVTETAAGNEHFGFTINASYDSGGGANTAVDVLHAPQGVTGLIV